MVKFKQYNKLKIYILLTVFDAYSSETGEIKSLADLDVVAFQKNCVYVVV
jgi:hypothetical protein